MASIAFPSLAKSVKLPSGTTYSYVWSPPSDSNPTILFLHGFPSSSYDWRHQISFFKAKKYGVLVPDLLGYGGTDKPASPEAYRLKAIATDIVAILDHEKLENVHAVGHDFGSTQLARMVNYFPIKLLSCAFLAVPYFPPGQSFNLDMLKVLTEQVMGFEKFGYMRFMDREDSGDVIDAHTDSISSVLYSGAEEMATHFYPAGALEAWLTNDCTAPLNPEILTEQEKEIRDRIFAKEAGGYRGPTNWYRVLVRGLDVADEKGLDPSIPCPALMIAEKESRVSIPGMAEGMGQFADDFMMKCTSTIGHWVQLEAKDEVNQMLEEFLKGLEG